MSKRLINDPHMRTTDHSDEILAMRLEANKQETYNEEDDAVWCSNARYALTMRVAADLLETHDATGISLDDWTHPRELVESILEDLHMGPLLKNGV